MPQCRTVPAAIIVWAATTLSPQAHAQPARAALVVGNATYTAMAGVPSCARSANVVSAALRAAGFEVTDRQDASSGGIDAGIGDFSQHLAAGKGAGFVYICGYATDFNDRTFLLPTTATVSRPSDVMTQGVLAKSMLAAVSHDPATIGVVVYDLVPLPGATAPIGLDVLAHLPAPDGVGVLAASETALADSPTPVAAALVAALAGPLVTSDGLLAKVQAQATNGKTSIVVVHLPVRPGALVGGQPAPEPAAAPVAAAVPAPAPAVPPVPTLVAPVTAGQAVKMPDEAQMTDGDRKTVQQALVRLGYYDRQVDANFGPETRAAIRRFQHEIGGDMTGHLTADQATRLVNSH
jgi:hypothetical protein